jgi:hypothetical protein
LLYYLFAVRCHGTVYKYICTVYYDGRAYAKPVITGDHGTRFRELEGRGVLGVVGYDGYPQQVEYVLIVKLDYPVG